MHRQEGADGVASQFVSFQFTDFIQSDYQGHESHQRPRRGYLVYNDRRKDFGFGRFGDSDAYTIDYDVLNQIRAKHSDFMQDIIQSGGFLMNGTWYPVNSSGELENH